MEINLQGDAFACIAREDIVAGYAVKLVSALNSPNISTGTYPDVNLGAMTATSDADTEARYVAAFRVYNEKAPIYEGLAYLDATGNPSSQVYMLRSFNEGDSNLPDDVKLRMGSPRLQEEQTILSGALMLAYDAGVYTVTSGCFTYSANLVETAYLKATTSGKWAYTASASEAVARVLRYDQTNAKLQIKTGW